MNNQAQNLKLDISLWRGHDRLEVFKSELPWDDGLKKRAQASISLASVGIDNVVVGLSCSPGPLNSLIGFVVFSADGDDQICSSFCCLPKISQSIRIKINSSCIIEIMMTNFIYSSAEKAAFSCEDYLNRQ